MSILNPYNFTVTDQSPLFKYLPSRDGPIATSWNVTYTGDSDTAWVADSFVGAGASSHRTTLAGASVELDWVGTAIYLYGQANNGDYVTVLDGTQTTGAMGGNGLLFNKTDLSYGSHSLVLRVVQGAATLSNAIITVGMGLPGSTVSNSTIQTPSIPITASGFSTSGTWDTAATTYAKTDTPSPRIETTHQGSAIRFPISSASAFYVTGSVNYNHGLYTVSVTPPVGTQQSAQYNGSSRWIGLDTILYLGTGMDRSKIYQVQITLDTDNQFFDMNQVVIFDTSGGSLESGTKSNPGPSLIPGPSSAPESSSSSNSGSSSLGIGAIVGIAIGGALIVAAAGLLIFCYLKRKRKNRIEPMQHDSRNYSNHPPNTFAAPYSGTSYSHKGQDRPLITAVGSSSFSSPGWRNPAPGPWDGSSVTATSDVAGSSQPTEAGRQSWVPNGQGRGNQHVLLNYASPTSYPSDLHAMINPVSSPYAPAPPAPTMMVQNGDDEYSPHPSTPSNVALVYSPPTAPHSSGVGGPSSVPPRPNPGGVSPQIHSAGETHTSATSSASTTDMERRLRELRDDADRALADLTRAQSAQASGSSRRDEDPPADGEAPPAYDSKISAHS